MIKKVIATFLITLMLSNPLVYAAENLPNIKTEVTKLKLSEADIEENANPDNKKNQYKYKTVLKRYIPYEVKITNNNKTPVLLNANTDIDLLLEDGSYIKSDTRRDIYKLTRKKDIGRYYGIAIPGAIAAGVVTVITLFIGTPLGALIAVGTMEPTNKAVRGNVDIAQELYKTKDLPIRLEAGKSYNVNFYIPKNEYISAIRINNLNLEKNTTNYKIVIPLETHQEVKNVEEDI